MFGWLSGFRRRAEAKAATTDEILRQLARGSEAKSGARVTTSTAISVSTVLACVRVIAEGVSQVPWKLYRVAGDGRLEARDDYRFDLIHAKPNDLQTSFEFRETIAIHAALGGNAYVLKIRTGGRILELLPLDPARVTIIPATQLGERPRYRYRVNAGTAMDLQADDVWHIKGPSWNTTTGLETIALAREAIGLALATEEHGARLFANGARPSGILTTELDIPETKLETIRDQWQKAYAGGENVGRTAVLSGGLDWKPITVDNSASQFLETRRFQIEEICRAFRVMPIMVGHADKSATYASAEQMFLAHVVHTLAPWYMRIEQSADAALLDPRDRAAGLYTKFNAQGLLRGDSRAFADFISRMVLNGVMTRNEARGLLELNPLDGLSEPLQPVNMQSGNDGGTANTGDTGNA